MKQLTLLFVLMSLLLSGCRKTSETTSQTLRINTVTNPATIDPRQARDVNSIAVCRMLFEGLTRISKLGVPELALAEKVDVSADGLTYTFHLKNTMWSNGQPVTAHDFVRTWTMMLDPKYPTDMAYQLYTIKNGKQVKAGELPAESLGVRAVDAETLVVELEQPVPYFLEVCATTPYFAVLEGQYNGPFVLDTWVLNDTLRVKKNPNYWDAKAVSLDAIEMITVSQDTELRLFEEKKLDWAGSPLSEIPRDAMAHFKETGQLRTSPFSGTYFFRVNTSRGPFAVPEFRKALAVALDRGAITTHILQGGQTPATSLVPPEMGLFERGYFGGESAQQLLETACQKLGVTVEALEPVEISFTPALTYNLPLVQAVQKQWETVLGIKVVLNMVDPKVYSAALKEGKFQVATRSWIADFHDPINFLEVFQYKKASTNNTFWEHPRYVELLQKSNVCRDGVERKRLLHEAEAVLMDEMPVIPVFHYALNYLQQDTVEGVVLSPLGQIDFRWAKKK